LEERNEWEPELLWLAQHWPAARTQDLPGLCELLAHYGGDVSAVVNALAQCVFSAVASVHITVLGDFFLHSFAISG
jgi:hypothetical protein